MKKFSSNARFIYLVTRVQARYRGYLSRKNAPAKIRAFIVKQKATKVVNRNNEGKEPELTYEDGSKYKGNIILTLRSIEKWFKRRLRSTNMA